MLSSSSLSMSGKGREDIIFGEDQRTIDHSKPSILSTMHWVFKHKARKEPLVNENYAINLSKLHLHQGILVLYSPSYNQAFYSQSKDRTSGMWLNSWDSGGKRSNNFWRQQD
ncbi:putative MFS-type transporter MJ1560 [Frankliniella fusca]|uniref:MFS-type transporter MJ1560 n=1 Tax=Frankliniella fusca TaxID=407009 RepID=A0AAE1LM37_9NEOP|nr:putative MFS-type transporter MJ1560 [Frankliniella fusca]